MPNRSAVLAITNSFLSGRVSDAGEIYAPSDLVRLFAIDFVAVGTFLLSLSQPHLYKQRVATVLIAFIEPQ